MVPWVALVSIAVLCCCCGGVDAQRPTLWLFSDSLGWQARNAFNATVRKAGFNFRYVGQYAECLQSAVRATNGD